MIHSLGCAIDLFIHPGEYEFEDEHFCLRTTLGSCVAITLWHPERRVGGMCHFMLPRRERGSGEPLSGKYGEEALELLFIEARKHGTKPEQYEVKLFGGGNMFAGYHSHTLSVAVRNVETARQLMDAHGLKIKSESLGGVGYRNVIFDITRGDVWVRHVASAAAATRSAAER